MFERVHPGSVGLFVRRLARITPWMEQYVAIGGRPGCRTAVLRKGQLAYLGCAGFADLASQRPVAEDTVFRIFVNKPIVTAAAMTLFEEGRLQLTTRCFVSCLNSRDGTAG